MQRAWLISSQRRQGKS